MKQIIIILSIALGVTAPVFSQNVGIGTSPTTNKLEVVSTVAYPGVAAILGVNNGLTGTAIVGSSLAGNTRGVVGQSNNGYGLQAGTTNGVGIGAYTISGIALNASSLGGYALLITGNLKFSGGNTNPTEGGVLSSDALGNSTWKKSNVAFLGTGALSTPFADGVFTKVEIINESYDLQNNFVGNNGTTTSASSVFTAPVAGVYHFSSNLSFYSGVSTWYFNYGEIKLVKNSAGILISRAHPYYDFGDNSNLDLQIVADVHLNAGDKVWVEALQKNGSAAESIDIGTDAARFSGHLVVAD
ncbi:MAG: hypothetical protein V4722_21880 [Bacteroidota bacterium]